MSHPIGQRRQYLQLGGAMCLLCAASALRAQPSPSDSASVIAARPRPPGCGQAPSTNAPGQRKRLSSTGDKDLDAAIRKEAVLLNKVFGVTPAFSFHDDGTAVEALALWDGKGTTVLLGLGLIKMLLKTQGYSGHSTIIGVLAHEWAHAYQYSRSTLQEKTYMWETHADFMAGWYLGIKKESGVAQIDSVAFSAALYHWGYKGRFFDADKYGSPNRRVAAMQAGFKFGRRQYGEYGVPFADDAATQGFHAVQKLIDAS